jgi:predicted metal-dependent phosphotriesterase family hydrolase
MHNASHFRQDRRRFVRQLALVLAGAGFTAHAATPAKPKIHTVLGPIAPGKLGQTLVHEHILCDFIGAAQTGRHRWSVEEVVATMRPYLESLRRRKFTGFVDCTPAYIGRDPRFLVKLSQQTRVQIVTNTGYYGAAGDKFVPAHAYEETVAQLADRWCREWQEGIEDTGVKPGFIKIGVDEASGNPPRLSDIDAKLVQAAAMASQRTGLSVTCHTGGGPAGLQVLEGFRKAGGTPSRLVIAHSDGHGLETNLKVASSGAWVSLDGIGPDSAPQRVSLVKDLLKDHSQRLLLSMDAGWYWAGEKGGGKVRDYNYLQDGFVPLLRKAGVTSQQLKQLLVENPAQILSVPARLS